MSGYGKRRYRSWRYRGAYTPSKYSLLRRLFGSAIDEIRKQFENLDQEALDELFSDYGEIHGKSAEQYARKTYPKWKSGVTQLSGQTMERLVELVPPYLDPSQRYSILQIVLKLHKKFGVKRSVKVNLKEPSIGLSEISDCMDQMIYDSPLENLPESVMQAATWLYDDDVTAARSMLAEASRIENELIVAKAKREIDLLKRAIASGQIKSANYNVEMPAGQLSIVAYEPSICFVASVCFGSSCLKTKILRRWRDEFLLHRDWGIKFTIWYYSNGNAIAGIIGRSKFLLFTSRIFLSLFVFFIVRCNDRMVKK